MYDESRLDPEIEQKLLAADESALSDLHERYKDRLKKMIDLRLDHRIRGRVDASDVLQESFIDLAKKLPEFKNKQMSAFVWIRLVVNERILDLHRKHLYADKRNARREVGQRARKVHDATSFSLAHALLGDDTSAAERMARKERQQALMEKLDELNENDKEVILLRTFEQLSNDQAAEVLGMSKYATSKRYIRALKKLKDLLNTIPGFDSIPPFNSK